LAGTALFLFRTVTLALLKYLQSFSEMSIHIGSASLIVHDAPGVGQNLRDHPGVHVRWHVKPDFPLPPDEIGPQKVALRYTARGSSLRNDMIMVMRFWGVQRLAVMSVGLYMAMGAGELTLQAPDPMMQLCLHYNYLQEAFDRQRLRDGVRLSLQLAGHAAFSAIMDTLYQPTEADLASNDALDQWLLRLCTKTLSFPQSFVQEAILHKKSKEMHYNTE